MTILLLALGLALLVIGGDILVRGAVGLATRFGVSPLLVGLTVVGFGTSTPELVTSLDAAFSGLPGIAVGNVVGSNTANILLILGISAMIAPVPVARTTLRRDGAAVGLAALAALAVVLTGHLSRPAGLVLIGGLVAYIVLAYRLERQIGIAARTGAADTDTDTEETGSAGPGALKATLLALGGIAVTIVGARLLVVSAVDIAHHWGVSDTIIGLTLVAVGTSLPELATSVMAALRGHSDIAFGNVVGSNIYNILGILGVTAAVRPIPVPPEIAGFDIWVMLAATLVLLLTAWSGGRVTRREGAAMVVAYGGYTAWLTLGA